MDNIFALSCIPSIHGDDFFYTSYSCSLGDIDDDVNCTSNRGLLWRDRDTGNLPSKRKSVSSALSLCTVEHPPRCPVLQASISVKASLLRTSPTTIRFGDSRKVFFSSASISTFSMVVSATEFSAVHFNSLVSSIVMIRSPSVEISARMAFRSVVFPLAVPPAAMTFR